MAWSRPTLPAGDEPMIVLPDDAAPPSRRDTPPMPSNLLDLLKAGGFAGLAIFLVYMLTTDLRVDVAGIKAGLALHSASSEKTERTLNSLVNVTVQQCVNAATTPAKRDACFVALTFAPVRDPK